MVTVGVIVDVALGSGVLVMVGVGVKVSMGSGVTGSGVTTLVGI
jgi:hypothetical protein